MIDWPDIVVDDLARRKAIVFLGSGISANSVGHAGARPPTWQQFLQRAVDACPSPKKHIQRLLKVGDYLTACEVLRYKLDDNWAPLLAAMFTTPRFVPAEIHDQVFKLGARIVLTQNFDKIYDTQAQRLSLNTVAVKNYYDTDVATAIRDHKYAVIKAHGTIDQPDRMIFTREQYNRARFEFAVFYDLMDALVLTHTFLFLGCGVADPDVQMMLARHALRFPHGKPHYMCMPANAIQEDVAGSLRRNYNLKIIRYSPRDNHAELLDGVKRLVTSVESRRDELAASQDW